jgi:heme/copper-type cytochrome/quinol oxidase subunit 2
MLKIFKDIKINKKVFAYCYIPDSDNCVDADLFDCEILMRVNHKDIQNNFLYFFNFQKLTTLTFFDVFVINLKVVDKETIIFYLSKFLRRLEDFKISYDSIIIADENLPLGYPRLLAVDQVLILPANTSVRLLVTSNDVIHS